MSSKKDKVLWMKRGTCKEISEIIKSKGDREELLPTNFHPFNETCNFPHYDNAHHYRTKVCYVT